MMGTSFARELMLDEKRAIEERLFLRSAPRTGANLRTIDLFWVGLDHVRLITKARPA
jgi:hypothetical protein